jgi:lysophospholipid acyltransferase (LPLAT)-like uncharacterized protein
MHDQESPVSGAAWEHSWTKRMQLAAIGAIATPLLRLLASTWRWRVEGEDRRRAAERDGRHAIHACWHGRIVHGIFHLRGRGLVVIVSENFDGEWIARIIRRLGFRAARGSSSRGARKALRQMVRESMAHPTAFTVDGPRGPARVAHPGAVWLSKATGNPVVPFHAEAADHWTLNSWDASQIPKPFTTVAIVMGEPFVVPPGASDPELERSRLRLERELAGCEARCHELLAPRGSSPDPQLPSSLAP